MDKAFFLTVEWCDDGKRGIFCHQDGQAFRKDDEPHTHDEMANVLGPFWLVLAPCSREFTVDELAKFTRFRPLVEYTNIYGIALEPSET